MHAMSSRRTRAEQPVESAPQPTTTSNHPVAPATEPESSPRTEVLDEMPAPEAIVPSGKLGDVYRAHEQRLPGMDLQPTSEHKWAMQHFQERYAQNAERYAAVAEQTGVPAELIAALHYRESSMQFDTYLHQGDPLGKKAVNHPNDIPIFHDWESAAVHALNQKKGVRDALGMTAETTDPAALATYAERYNGLGYHNRGKPSPYVYSGTDVYQGGKYVRDGVYDPRVWDRQPGVMALMGSLKDASGEVPEWANEQEPEEAWGAVVDGDQFVREGQRGPAIHALQDKLSSAGFEVSTDGHFGKNTRSALIAFQKANGLDPDGVVGPSTAAALQSATAEELAAVAEGAETTEEPSTEPPAEAPLESDNRAPATEEVDAWSARIAGGATLRRGAAGDAVNELQSRLAAAGHEIEVDGDFGPRTRAAVRAFQRAHGLKPDGIVGPKTAALLG